MPTKPDSILITDIQRFSVNDGPGIRTTVFLKGCPLSCFWCHNPETQSSEPELMFYQNLCIGCEACAQACPTGSLRFSDEGGSRIRRYDRDTCTHCGQCVSRCPTEALRMVGRHLDVDELLELLEQDRPYFAPSGGVTFSGGEPLLQAGKLAPIIRAVHRAGYHTVVDTAGCVGYAAFERILDSTDLFLYDLKTIWPELHREATGQDNRQILANLARLAKTGKAIRVRVPVIPGFNDTAETVAAIAATAASYGLTRLDLLPFHRYAVTKYTALGRTYAAEHLAEPPPGQIQDLAEAARAHIAEVTIEKH